MKLNPNLPVSEILGRIYALPQAQRRLALAALDQDAEGSAATSRYLASHPAAPDEALGYEHWLRKLGPHTFTGTFAWFHHEFWQWYWPMALLAQAGQPIDLNDIVCLIPWARNTGKSSHSEWAAIAEGALVQKGYVLWVSAKAEQAAEHVVSIRNRIEDEQVGKLYPWLAKPKVGVHGNRFGWGKEFLMTHGGWAVRPAGLDAYLRGGKVLDMRPSLIILSDIDEIGDSPAVVQGKEQMMTRSVIPMGNASTRVIFDQNPIHANSVMNRILTRASSALAKRRVIGLNGGPIPAFQDIDIQFEQTDDGPRHVIKSGTPMWADMKLEDCQAYLDKSGYEAFMAEYQHNLEIALEPRVLPEYDDRKLLLHVISWDMFEKLYGMRRIPSSWSCDIGVDLGYTTEHLSSWTFMAKVPEGWPLAGSIFRYRGRNFQTVSIDEQSIAIRREMWPDEQIQRQWISHEKLGERLLLAQKHGWAFRPCDSSKEAGWQAWRHYLRTDNAQPHPFHTDTKDESGRWRLGRPAFFDVVVHSQLRSPTDDAGMKIHRDSAWNHRRRPVKLTEGGLTVDQPVKAGDDPNDSCLVAGTMVTTQRGQVPIEQILLSDVVLTRQGWSPVERTGMTNKNAEIWSLKLSNGRRLRGTSEHPIWVAGYGWKPLSELKAGERLLSLMECVSTAIPTPDIDHIRHIFNPMFMPLSVVSVLSMLNYGKQQTALSRRAAQFIIGTIIRLIMPIPIWNYFPTLNIPVTIVETGHLNVLRDNGKSWLKCRNLPNSGTRVQQAWNGIAGILTEVFSQFQKSNWYVGMSRVINRLLDEHFGINTALTRASKNSIITVESVKREKTAPVYNVAVKDQPEFFANDVLVHNSRMIFSSASFGPTEKTMNQAQKIQAAIPTGFHKTELAERPDIHPNEAHIAGEMAEFLAKRQLGLNKPKLYDAWGQRI